MKSSIIKNQNYMYNYEIIENHRFLERVEFAGRESRAGMGRMHPQSESARSPEKKACKTKIEPLLRRSAIFFHGLSARSKRRSTGCPITKVPLRSLWQVECSESCLRFATQLFEILIFLKSD